MSTEAIDSMGIVETDFWAHLAQQLPVSLAEIYQRMSKQARIFLFIVCMAGLLTVIYGGLVWRIDDAAKFAAYVLTALLASRLKVDLPEITGTISVNFLFI